MAICMNCSSQTNYICLGCNKAICNKSSNCSVLADEETPSWKMGVSVPHCLECFQKNQGLDRDDQGLSPTPKSKPKVIKPRSGSQRKAESLTKANGSRKCLTLKEKIKVIQLSSKGGISTRKLASRFGCGKAQITKVLKNHAKITFGWNSNEKSALQKRSNNEKFSEVNKLLW